MELSASMTYAEAIHHLRLTFPFHLKQDVDFLAPFGTIRSLFTGTEYIGALYAGWNGLDEGKIVTKKKTVDFLREVFPLACGVEAYARFADHLYDMFRSGSVHLYLPKRLDNSDCSTRFLTWCLLTGERTKAMASFRDINFIASHLIPVPIEDTTVLPLAPQAFLDDLLKACKWFASRLEDEELGSEHTLIDRWRETADGLSRPARSQLSW